MYGVCLHKMSRQDEMARDLNRDLLGRDREQEPVIRLETRQRRRDRDHIPFPDLPRRLDLRTFFESIGAYTVSSRLSVETSASNRRQQQNVDLSVCLSAVVQYR